MALGSVHRPRPPLRRVGVVKRTPLRSRSKKTVTAYVERRRIVAFRAAAFPVCEVPHCTNESTDPHEPLTRARGGSITDRNNLRMVCRLHHDLIHAEPEWAYELGFLRHSWDPLGRLLMTAVTVHLTVPCPYCQGAGENGTHQNYWGAWETEQCQACDGTGEVTHDRAEQIRDEMKNPPEWEG